MIGGNGFRRSAFLSIHPVKATAVLAKYGNWRLRRAIVWLSVASFVGRIVSARSIQASGLGCKLIRPFSASMSVSHRVIGLSQSSVSGATIVVWRLGERLGSLRRYQSQI